jgi:hypothetical protein
MAGPDDFDPDAGESWYNRPIPTLGEMGSAITSRLGRLASQATGSVLSAPYGRNKSIEDAANERRAGFDPSAQSRGPSGRAGKIDPLLTTPPEPDYTANFLAVHPDIAATRRIAGLGTSPLGDMPQAAWLAANPQIGAGARSVRALMASRASTGGETADSMAPGRRSIEPPPTDRGSVSISAGTGVDPTAPGFGRPGVGDWKPNFYGPARGGESYAGPAGRGLGGTRSSSYRSASSGGTVSQSDVESLPWEQRPESWKTGQYEQMAFEAAKRAPMAGIATEAWKSSLQQHTEERIRREYLQQTGQAHADLDDEIAQILRNPMLADQEDPKKPGASKQEAVRAARERHKQRLDDIERAHAITALRGNPFGRGYYPQASPFGPS